MRNREGAFARYQDQPVELVGYTSCGGCPGGNVEYAPAEMKRNGAQVIHLATGLIVGYPPCPWLQEFCNFIPFKYQLEVMPGTHPIPQNYYLTHQQLGTWADDKGQVDIRTILTDEDLRREYD
jgi:predicted metal-binding protein